MKITSIEAIVRIDGLQKQIANIEDIQAHELYESTMSASEQKELTKKLQKTKTELLTVTQKASAFN